METTNTFTLLHYRPNGSQYIGCGESEYHDSEIGYEHGLTLEQLRRRIIDLTKIHRYEGDSDYELIVLQHGKPIACRGESLWSFEESQESHPDAQAIGELMDEARVLSHSQKEEKRRAEVMAEIERQQKAIEANDRRRFEEARKTIKELESRFGVKP